MVAALDRGRVQTTHWGLIYQLRAKPLHPREFREKWGVTNQDISVLLDVSLPLVERWFLRETATTRLDPEPKYSKRLAEIDYMWETLEQMRGGIERCPDHIKKAYDNLKDKKN